MFNDDVKYHPYVDYVQSANTLFHFMNKFGYLKTILLKRAIIPRYCIETVDYLRIQHVGIEFPKIAVLQKCFCDIPFHKLADTFSVTGTGDAYKELSAEEKFRVEHNNTHFDFYGGFAIGFSKSWSEQNKLQPIHYLNTESAYGRHIQELLSTALFSDDLPDSYAEDILSGLMIMISFPFFRA